MRLAAVLVIVPLIILSCTRSKEEVIDETNLPYPADEELALYQAEVDSGYLTFYLDIKMVAMSYLGNSKYRDYDIRREHVSIRGEGIFIGMVEAETQDFILQIRLERPFKSLGRKSIWQVKSVEEKPWPKRRFQSTE